ncbi:MAG: hypothetical protein A2Z75_01445 [Chloroflexi bacterium RBG_13_50_10]|nr:MAG: hypothetical protein A2Z75_01445 [Chloroflexi bacterium RBG_13_50_10]
METDDRIKYALENTELVRAPQRSLATFGSSVIDYYVVTELVGNVSVVRDGKVIAERPKIVTPAYLVNVEGFSEQARRYMAMMARERPYESGILYRYKNEPKGMNVVSEPIKQVISKLSSQIEEEHNPLSTIIRGVEEVWDVSLLMFIYELTTKSVHTNVAEFSHRGFLDIDASGVPQGARDYIEELFEQASRNLSRAPELVIELNRWGLFSENQDRFFALFRRR